MRSCPRRAAVLLVLATVTSAAHAAAQETAPPDPDVAQAEYVGRLQALAAPRAPELEAAAREAFDVAPCVRAELAVWLLVGADGAVLESRPDEASGHPGQVRDAVAAKVKTWKLPPPPGGKPARLRLPLGVLPTAPIPARLACEAELLDAGDYHVTQLVPGVERGKWRAVCATDTAATSETSDVRPVKVAIKRFRDAEDDADEKTGRRVTAKGCEAPALMFQHLSAIADGPVPTAQVVSKRNGWDLSFEISLGPVTTRLRLQPGPRGKDAAGDEPRPWKVVLESAGVTQDLDVGASPQPPTLAVRWAGDLDADGRPDFALEDRDDGVTLRLYVSGAARAGRAVRQVASTARGGR